MMFLILLVTDLVMLQHLLSAAIVMLGHRLARHAEQEPNLLLGHYITHSSPLKNQIEQRHVWKS